MRGRGLWGLYLGVRNFPSDNVSEFFAALDRVCDYLASSRPTAVNLFWALQRIRRVAASSPGRPVAQIKQRILEECLEMIHEDNRVCRAIGSHGRRPAPHRAKRAPTPSAFSPTATPAAWPPSVTAPPWRPCMWALIKE